MPIFVIRGGHVIKNSKGLEQNKAADAAAGARGPASKAFGRAAGNGYPGGGGQMATKEKMDSRVMMQVE
ncbi:MAG: hypothetical protein R3E95_14490 [Thiolinea sp.]